MKHAAVMLLLSAGVAGQGVVEAEARRSHLGRVLGPGGDPVSGASVTFLSGGDGLGSDADAVRVVARDNGRFRAELLRGRHYRAYAVAPAGSLLEAAPVVSALSELGVPVTELRFSADQVAAPAETFEIHGLEPWRELGEVRVQLWLDGCRQALEDEVVGPDGAVRVPPLPRDELEAFVFVGGQLVHAPSYGTGLSMPRPYLVRGRVLDAGGAAIAGATIHRVCNSAAQRGALPSCAAVRRFEVAQTDADGRAEWLLADYKDPFEGGSGWGPKAFVASAAGFRGCVAGFNGAVSSNHEIITDRVKERTLPFVLERAQPLQVSFDRDVKASGITWTANYQMQRGEGAYNTHFDVGVGEVVSSGSATVPPWPRGAEEPRVFLLGVTPRLAPDHPFARAVAPWPLEVPLASEAGARVVASAIVPVCVRVVSAAGGPAAGAEVGLFSLERGLSDPFAVPAATDSAGRLVLPASSGRYVVVALGRREWARHAFEVTPSMEPIELRLEPIAQMRLRTVDVEGRPLEGVGVGSSGASSRSVRDPLQAVLLEISQSFHGRYFSGFASDRDGRLVLSFLPSESRTVSFKLRSDTFGGPTFESSRLWLAETEEPEEVVLYEKKE